MLGRVSDAELIDVYRAADVAVVPTLAVEGFGLVVLEAAACGTPSVVSDVGGLPEAAAPLDPSLVVAPADAAALGSTAAHGRSGRAAQPRGDPELRRALLLAAAGRAPPRALRSPARGRARRAPARRLPRPRRAAVRRRDRAAAPAALPAAGATPHVILGEEGLLAERLQQAGISVEVLAVARLRPATCAATPCASAAPRRRAPLHTLAYVARLARRLRALRPDLVHTNSLKAGRLRRPRRRRPPACRCIWHLRDRIAEDYLPGPAVRLMRAFDRRRSPTGWSPTRPSTLGTLPGRVARARLGDPRLGRGPADPPARASRGHA